MWLCVSVNFVKCRCVYMFMVFVMYGCVSVCVCGFCKGWLCVCVDFLRCVFVYVCFCKVWVCGCVDFLMCGCVYV